ncbi:MAG: PhoH family protein, partial [Spirochaetales bacterium]|nr:PhoH family protein [Spirochaetales bacterium]
MAETYVFGDDSAESVLGPNDRNLSYLELILGSDMAVRGDSLTIFRNSPKFIPLMKRLEEKGRERGVLDEGEIYMEFQAISQEIDEEENKEEPPKEKVIKETISVLGKTVWPKTKNQKEFINALASNQIIFASGPAGTGKTFLSNCIAKALIERQHSVVYERAGDMFRAMSKAEFSNGKNDDADYIGQRVTECELLILDDLGTEFSTEYTRSRLYS